MINVNIVILSIKIKDLSAGLKRRLEMTEKRVKLINTNRHYLILVTEKKLKYSVSNLKDNIKSLIYV